MLGEDKKWMGILFLFRQSGSWPPFSPLSLPRCVSYKQRQHAHTATLLSVPWEQRQGFIHLQMPTSCNTALATQFSVCVEFNSSFYKGLPRIWFYGHCVECSEADKNEHIYSSHQEASWSCKRNTSEDEGWLQMTATHITAVNKIQRFVFLFLNIKEAYREAVQRQYGVPWSPETQASVLPPLSFDNGFILKVTLWSKMATMISCQCSRQEGGEECALLREISRSPTVVDIAFDVFPWKM